MKDQQRIIYLWMRVLFCKIHCPSFICFCKPSPTLLYSSGPLKLENSTHVPSSTTTTTTTTATATVATAESSNGVEEEIVDVVLNGQRQSARGELKSSLKKSRLLDSNQAEKKRVQWIDFLGKELVQMREYESSETDDTDSEDQSNRGCSCIIL